MPSKRRGGFCRALLLAASATAIFMGTARAQSPAEELGDLNARILNNPQDTELNLQYARIAEQHGKLRLALAAYERILINDPTNAEAQRGFARVRGVIEPPFQSKRVEFGGRWDSDPLNEKDNHDSAWSAFVRATMVDERRIGSHRWRTVGNLDGEVTPDHRELDYGYLGVQTGPILDVAPHLSVVPAIGVGTSTLGDSNYFNEVQASTTLEGQRSGTSFWARARVNYRQYSDDSTADKGTQFQLSGGVTRPHIVSPRDSLTLSPWARWSAVDGSIRNSFDEEVAPGRYTEFGLEAAYHYRVNDNLSVSWGVISYRRDYSRTEVAGEDRHDTYVAPQAELTVWNALPCACAIRLNVRHRHNESNDRFSDYDADQVSASLFAQF